MKTLAIWRALDLLRPPKTKKDLTWNEKLAKDLCY